MVKNLQGNSEAVVGVVGKPPIFLPKLSLDNLYICSDSDALALIGSEYYSNALVIAMVIEDGVRVSIICKHKIIATKSYKTDPVQELGKILSVFGPAIVLIAGSYNLTLDFIENALANTVKSEILQQTYIKESNNLLLIAASRLHIYKKQLDNH